MALALFDLDNTLLQGDSDHAWCEFLIEAGILDGATYREKNETFYAAYVAGKLDIYEFLDFQLKPLAAHSPDTLQALHAEYMRTKVQAMISPAALALVDKHRRLGDELVIITATNNFVTRPIATAFGIDHLIATEAERIDTGFTGKVTGIPCFREGKVKRLHAWLKDSHHTLAGSHFYSDSHNDLPLLQTVDYPIAANPDPILRAHAMQASWPILDLSGDVIRTEVYQQNRRA